jgi:hypothetical protein
VSRKIVAQKQNNLLTANPVCGKLGLQSTINQRFNMQLLGTELKPEARREALARFVHRFTAGHKPQWASQPWKDGKPYPVQFASDADWLEHTYFEVTKSGTLSNKVDHCHSSPTWPNNPELRNRVPLSIRQQLSA